MIRAPELRFVFVIEDYDAAVRLYRDVFGLEVVMDLGDDGGRGLILKVPAATLELADVEHGRIVDEIEVCRPVDDRLRIAVEVDELSDAVAACDGRPRQITRRETRLAEAPGVCATASHESASMARCLSPTTRR